MAAPPQHKMRQGLLAVKKEPLEEPSESAPGVKAERLQQPRKPPGPPKPQRVLVCGDLEGRLDLLQRALKGHEREGKPVDFVLAVGKFLPDSERQGLLMSRYLGDNPEQKLLAPVYFADRASDSFIAESNRAPAVARLLAKKPRIAFLGACGVTEVHGYRIAYLSGCYDAQVFKTSFGVGRHVGNKYTINAVEAIVRQAQERGGGRIDVLLTSEWPDTYWSTATQREERTSVNAAHASPAVRQLVFALKPRYHICASADRHLRRKASTGPQGLVMTTVALATARSTDREDIAEWSEVMLLRPDGDDDTARRTKRVPLLAAGVEDDGAPREPVVRPYRQPRLGPEVRSTALIEFEAQEESGRTRDAAGGTVVSASASWTGNATLTAAAPKGASLVADGDGFSEAEMAAAAQHKRAWSDHSRDGDADGGDAGDLLPQRKRSRTSSQTSSPDMADEQLIDL